MVFVNEKDVFVRAVTASSLFEVTHTGAAHSVRIGRVVVVDAVCRPVEATDHHKVSLVLGFPTEALLSHREEAAVFDGRRAELTAEDHCIHQDYGHVTLLQVGLDLLHRHRALFYCDAFTLRF